MLVHAAQDVVCVESAFLVQTHEDQLLDVLKGTSEMNSKAVWGF